MNHQVICNEYTSVKDLQNGIQFYLNLYGDSAKVVVKVAPIIGTHNPRDLREFSTKYLLTLLIFEKAKLSNFTHE